jgi:hypothetical protein
MLIAACEAEGAHVMDLGIVKDDAAGLERRLDEAIAAGANVLVTVRSFWFEHARCPCMPLVEMALSVWCMHMHTF